jgi:D-3-phosphoglycerate dehydrogenase
MKIAILDDYFDTLRTLPCFEKLAGHDVTVFTDHVQELEPLAHRLRPYEGGRLVPGAKPRSARRSSHACRRFGLIKPAQRISAHRHRRLHQARIVVSSSQHPNTPSYAAAELTWGLVLAACRQIPQQMASLKTGGWQVGVGSSLRGKTLGIYGYGRIGQVVADYGRAFGMQILVWAREQSLAARAS